MARERPENLRSVISESPLIFTIGVAGDSGSGKTTFTRGLREIFGESLVSTITLDDYHTLGREERHQRGITPLAPEANDFGRLEHDLALLKAGKAISKPVYNHAAGTLEGPVPFEPTKILILEGLHTMFTPGLRKLLDFSLFVDPDPGVKTIWKKKRDLASRNYTETGIEEERAARARDFERYVAPQRRYADATVSIGFSKYGISQADNGIYRVTLTQTRSAELAEDIDLEIDLFSILALCDSNFLLEFQKKSGKGGEREMGALTIDGSLPYETVRKLERSIERQTGVHPISLFSPRRELSAGEVVQLILCWRIINRRIFLEHAPVHPRTCGFGPEKEEHGPAL